MWLFNKKDKYEKENFVKMALPERETKENILRSNYKMLENIKESELDNIGKFMERFSYQTKRRFYRRSVFVACKTCGHIKEIPLTRIVTKEEFLKLASEECNKCDEIIENLEVEYKERIDREEKIKEVIKPGNRVKVDYYSEYMYGTLVRYDDSDVRFRYSVRDLSIYGRSGAYLPDGSFHKAEVLLDKGLRTVEVDLSKIEKYDNRLTESEIKYITDILERHSIDNYADATLISMNKNIINKISK